MKKAVVHLAILIFIVSMGGSAYPQDKVKDIIQRNNDTQNKLKEQSKEHQKMILAKVQKFFEKVAKFAPGFKLQAPVKLAYAEDVTEMTQGSECKISKYKTEKVHYAHLSEPYNLRSGPSDG